MPPKESFSLAERHRHGKNNLCKYSKAKAGHRMAIDKGSVEHDNGKVCDFANDETSDPVLEGSTKSSPST